MPEQNFRILIVADNASSQFGGEAAIPWHLFRVLRKRGLDAWLIVHERVRDQLEQDFPDDIDRIYFIKDRALHRQLHALSEKIPSRLSGWTTGYLLRLLTQIEQRNMIKSLIPVLGINVIHQPTPVSPKETSLIFGLGVPVVIGPMNGGMNYPPAFRGQWSNPLIDASVYGGRLFARVMNVLIPGKRQAAALLVANERTFKALPVRNHQNVVHLVENGVDLSLWQNRSTSSLALEEGVNPTNEHGLEQATDSKTRFVFVGRLVDWKGIDLLLLAFRQVLERQAATLEIIGDGKEYASLRDLAISLGFSVSSNQDAELTDKQSDVHFSGWLSQAECVEHLQSSDVLVLPSLYECGGAVVLEAMAMGLPAIATNWGGPADYLDESCGILVDPVSREQFIQGFADAMGELAAHPERRAAMGRAGRERVRTHFDWEAKVTRVLEIYEQVTASPCMKKHPSLTKGAGSANPFSKASLSFPR